MFEQTLAWIREHVGEEIFGLAGGILAYEIHSLYHRIIPRLVRIVAYLPRLLAKAAARRRL